MKLINEKGKLFGIINLVDLACILLVILVVVGVGWKLLGGKVQEAIEDTAPTATMTATVRIRGVTPFIQDWLTDHDLTGSQLVAGSDYVEDAYIIDAYTEPYVAQLSTDDGRIVDAEDPSRVDLIVTLQAPVDDSGAVLRLSTQEVRVGRSITVKTHTFEMSGTVEAVVVE